MKVIQIAIDGSSNEDIAKISGLHAWIYGLGDDGNVYFWNIQDGTWIIPKRI